MKNLMSNVINRRQFLSGDIVGRRAPLRPPWALDEDEFTLACTRCNQCIEKCPQHILESDNGGFPSVNFMHAECTFCGDCVTACADGALLRANDGIEPWDYKAQIDASCLAIQGVECRVCEEQCQYDAIKFRPRARMASQPVLIQSECRACGACIQPCPAQAITISVWR